MDLHNKQKGDTVISQSEVLRAPPPLSEAGQIVRSGRVIEWRHVHVCRRNPSSSDGFVDTAVKLVAVL